MKHVLLLGGSGFIGSAILQHLLDTGRYKVTALQRKHTLPPGNSDQLEIIHGSLSSLDIRKLKEQPDIIIHAARNRTGKWGSIGRYAAALKGEWANRKLLAQAEQARGDIKLIYLSGSLMYGSHPGAPVTENTALSPISYAREYIRAELPFINAINKGHTGITMLRVPWVVGNKSWFRWYYTDYMACHHAVPVYGPGKGVMTFIDVQDLAAALGQLCGMEQLPPVLNLFYPRYLTQQQWAELLAAAAGLPICNQPPGDYNRMDKAAREAFEADIQLHSIHTELQKKLQQDMKSPEEMVMGMVRRES